MGKVYIDGKEVVSQAANGTVKKKDDPVYTLTKNKPGEDTYKNDSGSIANPAGSTFHSGTNVATAESALTNGQHGTKTSIGGLATSVRDGPAVFLGEWGKQVWIEGHKVARHLTKVGTTAIYAYMPAVKNIAKNVQAIATMMDGDLAAEMAGEFGSETLGAVKELFTMDTLGGLAADAGLAALTAGLGLLTPFTGGASTVGAVASGAATTARVGQRVYAMGETAMGAYGELSDVLGQLAKPDLSPAEQKALAKRAAGLLAQLPRVLAALLAKRNLSKKAKTKTKNADEEVKTTQDPAPKLTPCPCETGSPVFISTGEKSLGQTDFSLNGFIPIEWRRQYRSGDTRTDGWFGQGWSHPLATELWIQADQLLYFDDLGRQTRLPLLEVGESYFDAYEQFTVVRAATHQWHLQHTNGETHRFGRYALGQWRLLLADISDRNQNRIQLHYVPSSFAANFDPFAHPPRPSHITDSAGRLLQLGWTSHGQLSTVHALAAHDGSQGTLLAHYQYAADPIDSQSQLAPPNLVAHTNPSSQTRRFEWSQHLLVGYTQASGHRHRNTYDQLTPNGRVTLSENVDDGTGLQFAYEQNRTWIKDALGRLTAFAFDERKDVVAVRNALGQITQTPYDANGHPQGTVDALGRRTSTVFDRRGNLTQMIDAAGHQTRVEYNSLDLPVKIVDPLGHVWRFDYDEHGNRTRTTTPLGTSTQYQIGPRGLPTQITDALGKTKQLQWDQAGQLLAYTDCSNRTTRFSYNALGHLLSTTNALGQTTVNEFDALGRVRRVIQADGASHHYEWDGEGRLLAYIDPLGQSTRYEYSSGGDPVVRIDAHGKALHYQYDKGRRLVGLVNENGAKYEFRYDLVDNLTDEVGVDGRHQRYCYNVVGELTHVIETGGSDVGPGKVTHLERDVLGRLVAKRFDGAQTPSNPSGQLATSDTTPDTTYTYDPLGRLTSAVSPSAHLRFAYDALGQIVSETQILGQGPDALQRKLAHQYDALGNRLQTLLPDGRSLNWLFYGSGHLHQINLAEDAGTGQEPVRHVLADMERDALHREVGRSQGQLKSQFDYDPAGRLVRHRASRQGTAAPGLVQQSSAVLERAYAYDAVGQLIARADSLRGRQDFKYDPVGRILSALPTALPGAGISHTQELFAFDPAGNLLPHPSSDPARDGIIADNRLRFYQDLAFEYDEHGNVTQRIRGNQGAGTHSQAELTWNDDHQLTQATVTRHGVTQTTRYAYDALGRRVSKTDAFGSTHYLWDGDLMIHSQRGNKEALFIFEPISFVPLATVQGIHKDKESQQTYWYQCDQIGAPQELTDEQGHIVWAADYKVWGEAKLRAIDWPRTGTDGGPARGAGISARTGENWSGPGSSPKATAPPIVEQPFRFQGQQFDEETGLHYNRYRYYDPICGRFISSDPIGLAGGINKYVYVANPNTWMDPLGLCSSALDRALGGKSGDEKQAHHLIPEEIWGRHEAFFKKIGMGGQMDEAANGILMPDSAQKARSMRRKFYHCGSHPLYSALVESRVKAIKQDLKDGKIDANQARNKIGQLQQQNRILLSTPGRGTPVRLG